ncbi:MAG: 2-amino-4-hydroxy-6-hydroxymethyldihydropteridine diphosphokinase [Pseudomonadota bacterium]|nr:2-amino-4-hydroxy-6-hydroxymethyldihydropteridine diphosphokinase [Pseudomonadota bacterium]
MSPIPVPVAIAFGASLGDRAASIRLALHALDATEGLRLVRTSRLYATAAVGGAAGAVFFNAVARFETTRTPSELLPILRALEVRLGRRPTRRWADRVIDLDLLLYGRQVVTEPGLRIPHPRMVERAFVMTPLREAWPDAINPYTGLRYADTLPAPPLPVVGVLPQPALVPASLASRPTAA